ncbi:MAG TPA: YceI family protein [Gammaproteobacteria bacterium]
MSRKQSSLLPRSALALVMSLAMTLAAPAHAKPENFQIDKGHTFVTFKVSHIGFAWIPGAFTDFSGDLVYDAEKPANSKVTFTVRIPSLTTSHAERDKHLKSDDFFNAEEHDTARFVSTAYEPSGGNSAILRGNLTIKDITKPIEFKVTELAAKQDPWGNFRRGFEAEAELNLADYKLDYAGAVPETATVIVSLEATRAK